MIDNKKKKKGIFRRVRLRTIFLLAITLSSNTFAWFIYSTKVSNDITAKVRSWNVNFVVNGDQEVDEYIEMNIDSLYPGMDTYSKTLTVSNTGESDARISYEVLTANVLGDNLLSFSYTPEQIINKLRNDYPFTIDFNISNDVITSLGGQSVVSLSVYWPYESGNDNEDTRWGNLAYDYHQNNSELYSISVVIKITAVQDEE